MKSFKICLDMILKKITTSTEIHGKLNTPLTSPLAEHAAQKNFLSLKLPCIEVLTFSLKILDRRKTRNTSTKLISWHYSQEIMSCCLDNHNVSKSDIVKKCKTSFRKIDNNYWLPGTLPVVGDSIVKELDKKRLNMNIEIELEFSIEIELKTYVKLSSQSSRKDPSFWNKRC